MKSTPRKSRDNVVDIGRATKTPDVTIVIPVFNEQGILSASLSDLLDKLSRESFTYEIIVAENGSTDETVRIAEEYASRHPQIRVLSVGEPNYGRVLK
jgi:glycosyltransferase involved in cell wall biosynthesis